MSEVGIGERKERSRRRRFWIIVAALVAMGMVAGIISGILTAQADNSGTPIQISPVLAWGGVGILAAGFLWGCWAFYKSIDEVELVDNLWGSTAGFYAYAVLLGSWAALHQVGAASEPNQYVIFAVSLVAATMTYLIRKWRAR